MKSRGGEHMPLMKFQIVCSTPDEKKHFWGADANTILSLGIIKLFCPSPSFFAFWGLAIFFWNLP
jgi:hypothetical protein